jgi:hypothetical protein
MTDPVTRTLGPIVDLAFTLHASSGVNSALESTRIYWREKLGMSPEEARDPRPFSEVLTARAPEGGEDGKGEG